MLRVYLLIHKRGRHSCPPLLVHSKTLERKHFFMLENLIISVQAVFPLFFMMLLGLIIRKKHWLNPDELSRLNNVVFNLIFPFLVFNNIYTTDLKASFYPQLILFSVLGVFLTFLIAWVIIPKNRTQSGQLRRHDPKYISQ